MILIAHTSREVALRLQDMYPAYVTIMPDGNGMYYVYRKKKYVCSN